MNFLKIKLLVIAVIMFAASSAFASYTFNVDVNTSSLIGQTGYIDLQMNADNSGNVATATTSNYASDAAFVGAPDYIGNASGLLADNTLSIDTADKNVQMNDYFHQLTFGNNLHFQLNLDGMPSNTFSIAFYNSDQTVALFSTADGAAAMVDLTENGPVITKMSNEVNVTPTPIPAAAWMLGSGLMGLAGMRKRMRV
jgi:hypothetical protein